MPYLEALLDSCGATPQNTDARKPLFRKGQRVRDRAEGGFTSLIVLKVLERDDPENPIGDETMGRFGGRYYAVNHSGSFRDGWFGRSEKDLEALEG